VIERFNPRGNVILVTVKVLGPAGTQAARLILDTGAAFTILRPSFLSDLGYDLASPRSVIRIASAIGQADAPLHIVHRMSWLTAERPNLGVLVLPLQGVRADGVLGINFLRGTRLTIDFRSGQIADE
jgi:predicted aspartyl protease